MRKKILLYVSLFLFAISFVIPMEAQQRTGNIFGKVVDGEGIGLPGVSVTLTSQFISPMTTITSGEGNFRFMSLAPGIDYALKCELDGFSPSIQTDIIVNIGQNINLEMTLTQGSLSEEITVIATTPVVDRKKTSITQNVTQDALQGLPSARDPWVVLQMAPSVTLDRENVGGSESGSQSMTVARGAQSDSNNMYTVDGAVITDVSSAGSAVYYDFDSFEEMTVTVGGNDVTQQTGGISVNMVTHRGGNNVSLGGRIYIEDESFQAENLTDELRDEGIVGTNKVIDIRDYGLNFGGPIVRDMAWYWMSYGVQDLKTKTIYGTPDNTLLTNINGKINLQLMPQNRLEIYGSVAKKQKIGRSASYSNPNGYTQFNFYHWGSPILKIQDEHMFSDKVFVSAKYTFVNSGFSMASTNNEDESKIGLFNVATGVWDQHQSFSGDSRPRHDFELFADYFNDNLLGVGHDIKAGLYLSNRGSIGKGTSRASYRYNYNYPTVDVTGDGYPDVVDEIAQVDTTRFGQRSLAINAWATYLRDTITAGNFTFLLGVRYDQQAPKMNSFPINTSVIPGNPTWDDNFTPGTAEAITAIFPGMESPEVDPGISWKSWSPRFGVTWDIEGTGRTIAKLSVGQYGDFMMTGTARLFEPQGTGGQMDFWWLDNNSDGMTDYRELYWHNSVTYAPYRVFDDGGNFIGNAGDAEGIMWSGYDFNNPSASSASRYTVGDNWGSTRSQDLILTVERELIPDLGVALNLTARKYDRFNWGDTDLDYFPETGHVENSSDYIEAGIVPSQVGGFDTKDGAGRPYYLKAGSYGYSAQYYVDRQEGMKNVYYGADFVVNKRLSNRWMLNASMSWQMQKAYYGDGSYVDPTSIWALDGYPYAAVIGSSSGKIDQNVFSRFMFKASGIYQLPWDLSLGFNVNGREGNIITEYLTIIDYNAPNPRFQEVQVYCTPIGSERLSFFWNFDLKIEKMLKLGDIGRIYVVCDVFNVLNRSPITRRYERNLGRYYPHNGLFVEEPTNFLANEILNPRVIRLGIRFKF